MNVTVVTPSYNQGRFINKCLDSVKCQHVNVEHIILDNCSSDETLELLSNYNNLPGNVEVRIFVEPDNGQTDAINRGFAMAKGDIICWLNTDEWYYPGALKLICEFFDANPDIDVVFGDCDFVNASGNLIKHKREYFFSYSMLLFYGCYLPSCSTFIRRSVIENNIYLDGEFKVTMDFDWYVRIANEGYRFAHLPVPLASFTWHDANISSNYVERRLIERRLVQDRYSGVVGPDWFRTLIYACMRYFWLIVRVLRRFLG